MPIEPKQFMPARNDNKRLNTARALRESLIRRLALKRELEEHRSNIVIRTRLKRDDRNYFWFRENFEPYLHYFFGESISLIDILEKMYLAKNRTLRLADYGGANGLLLKDIDELCRTNTPYSQVLVDLEIVDARQRSERVVGKYTQSLAEEHIFDKPVDILFDNFGPLSYTDFDLRKEILLKHLESLTKGGMLFCSFEFSNKKKGTRFIYGEHIILGNENYFGTIEKAMLKRGFKARFYKRRSRDSHEIQKVFLIAQRTDEFLNKK